MLLTGAQLPKQIAVHVKGRYLNRLDDILSVGVVEFDLFNPKVLRSPPGELVLFVCRQSLKELLDMGGDCAAWLEVFGTGTAG